MDKPISLPATVAKKTAPAKTGVAQKESVDRPDTFTLSEADLT